MRKYAGSPCKSDQQQALSSPLGKRSHTAVTAAVAAGDDASVQHRATASVQHEFLIQSPLRRLGAANVR